VTSTSQPDAIRTFWSPTRSNNVWSAGIWWPVSRVATLCAHAVTVAARAIQAAAAVSSASLRSFMKATRSSMAREHSVTGPSQAA